MSEKTSKANNYIATVEKEIEVSYVIEASSSEEAREKYLEILKNPLAHQHERIDGETIRKEIIGLRRTDKKAPDRHSIISVAPTTTATDGSKVLSMQDYLNRQSD